MSKFHINKHGVPAPCKATEGNCPLGGDEEHFSSQADAQAYADKVNEKEYGLIADVGQESNVDKKEKKLTPAQEKRKAKKEFEERLSKVLNESWGGDEQMVKHCLKRKKYIEMDGSFVEISDSKPKISREMWYNDETEAPEVNYENFYNSNKGVMPRYYEKEGRNINGRGTLKLIPQYGGDNLDLATLSYEDNHKGPYREVTDEELKQINKGIEEVRKDYDKRIKSYYNRYKDKIVANGYWANR